MQATGAEVNKMQLAILYEFIQEHPDIRQTNANGKVLGAYLAENGLPVSWRNLTTAYTNLRAAGKLELAKTPEEIQKEQIERAREIIYADVATKIAPAVIDFKNPVVLNKISTFLWQNEKGLMSTDRVLLAIEAHKFDEGFWTVPPADLYRSQDFVRGMRNHSKDEPIPEQETETRGRRNHATDTLDRESAAKVKKIKQTAETEEGRVIAQLWEQQIDGYRAVVNGRISWSKTEAIQNLLRKWLEKGKNGGQSSVIELMRNMPDDADEAAAWLRRRL